jgi:hypothetical protein
MLSGTAHLSMHGKWVVAESMYAKGKNFLAAAILLRQSGGYEYVVLHLICQGIEITLKALLLFKDYDRYKGQLRKPLDHNLNKIVAAATMEFSLRPISGILAIELATLNSLYSKHLLRYGTVHDILVNPQTIAGDLTLHRMAAVTRLADRHLRAKP